MRDDRVDIRSRQRICSADRAADEWEELRVNLSGNTADSRGSKLAGLRSANRKERINLAGQIGEGNRRWRKHLCHVDERQANAVDQNIIGANQRGRLIAAHGRDRDLFFKRLVEIRWVCVKRVNPVAFDADAARVLAVLVNGHTARIARQS